MRKTQAKKTTWWWSAPEYFNKWRVFPRMFILIYMWMLIQMTLWFIALEDPTNAQAGFVSVVVGAGAAWFGLYVNSGSHKTQTPSALTPARRAENEDDIQRASLPTSEITEAPKPTKDGYKPKVVGRHSGTKTKP